MTQLPVLKAKDFATDQDVRWCPGCGDYAILNQVKKTLATIGATRENSVFVAGIGCSSRFPYYMETYGFHSIHGRAPGFATGIKLANPELDVWMVTGDGDGLSIGGNHLMHLLRRNVGIKVLLFNNQIYGLTKGQYSPTSEQGKRTPSTPLGSLDEPLNPLSIAVGSKASFIARSVDVDKGLGDMLQRCAAHNGTTFLEIYQDCNVFNHKAFGYATDKDTKEDALIRLEHGKPMVFGKDENKKPDKGIRLTGDYKPEVVQLKDVAMDDLLIHDEHDLSLAFLLAQMRYPHFPEPIGVLHAVERPQYQDQVKNQVAEAIEKRGAGTLEKLIYSGDVYDVEAPDSAHGLHE